MSAIASFLAGAGDWLLETEVHVALLVVFVALAQALLGRRIAPRWRHALWLVVAIRLAVPGLPPSPFGSPRLLAAPTRESPPREPGIEIASREVSAPAPPDKPAGKPMIAALGEERSARAAPPAAKPLAPGSPGAFRWAAGLGSVWLCGCVIMGVAWISSGRRLRSILREARPATDPDLLRSLTEAAALLGIKRPPLLLLSRRIGSPGLAGALRPKILLPEALPAKIPAADLRSIFIHELSHVRRQDPLTGFLAAALTAAHWINPLAWWALGRLREERELACDEEVLRSASELDPLAYARTVLRVARLASLRGAPPFPLGAGIHSGPRLLEKRIRLVSAFEPRRRPGTLLAAILLVLFTALGLTRAPGADPGKELITREYPVEALIQPRQDSKAPSLGVVIPSKEKQVEGPPPEELAADRKNRLDQLVRIVRSTVFPRTASEGMKIAAEGTSLRITAHEDAQREVERLLQRLAAEEGLAVKVEAEVLGLDEAALEKLPSALVRDLRVSAFRRAPLSISPADASTLLDASTEKKSKRSSPVLITFDHQQSHLLVVQQESLIVDIRAPEGPKKEPEPIVGILNTGVMIEARPTVSADRKAIALELGFEKYDVRRPIQHVEMQGIKIAVPESCAVRFRQTISLSSSAWGVAGVAGPSSLDGLLTAVLVRATVVEPEKPAK